MAFKRPTLKELVERIQRDLDGATKPGSASLRASWNFILARVLASQFYLIYGFIFLFMNRIPPWALDDEMTPQWANVFDVNRKTPSYATRVILVSGANGSYIDAEKDLRTSDGVEFQTLEAKSISAGSVQLAVVCKTAGVIGNLPTGATLNFVVPIAGVNSSATVVETGKIDGQDLEKLSYLYERFLERVRKPAHGGAESDYIFWAKEIPGVTRAWVYPQRIASNSVSVCFVMDNKPDTFIPTPAEVALVDAYIKSPGIKPATADVYVYAPIPVPVNPIIKVTPDTPEVRDAVQNELKDLFARESVPEGKLLISHIHEAISLAAGEFDHELLHPAANVVADIGHISTLGVIEWA